MSAVPLRERSSSPPTASSHSSPSTSDYPSDFNMNLAQPMPLSSHISISNDWSVPNLQSKLGLGDELTLEDVIKEEAFGPASSDPTLSAASFDSLQLFPFSNPSQHLLHYPQPSFTTSFQSSPDVQQNPLSYHSSVQDPTFIYSGMSQQSHSHAHTRSIDSSPTDYSASYVYSSTPASHPQTPAASSSGSSPQSMPQSTLDSADSIQDDVVYPPRAVSGLKVLMPSIPATGAKSRVETQIKVVLQLVMPETDVSAAGRRVGTWSWIRLERGAALRKRPRTCGKGGVEPKESDVLQLVATVHPASQPSLNAYRCASCHQREVKRVARKLALRVRPPPSPSPSPPPEQAPGLSEREADEKRMVIFNCCEMQELKGGEVSLPTRLVCYCRHHREKVGFCVSFKFYTHDGRLVAEGTSPPIMITDDHKSRNPSGTEPDQPVVFTRLDRPIAAQEEAAPIVKRRRPTVDEAEGDLGRERRPRKKNRSAASTPPTADSLGASPSSLPAPIPSLIAPLTSLAPQPTTITAATHFPGPASPLPPRPSILRVIPTSGPVAGGIEITLLGTGFSPTTAPVFGDIVASSWTMYGDNAMVCILPPSACPGPVRVGLDGFEPFIGEEPVIFCYEDQTDRALMELALQVVGLKMNGRLDDARDIAMQIMVNGRSAGGDPGLLPSGGGAGMPYGQTMYAASRLLGRAGQRGHDFQSTVIALVRLLDAPISSRGSLPVSVLVSRSGPNGLTLLHLAVTLNFHRLCALLVSLGADADARDRSGYTPLHIASMRGRLRCARVLVAAGADSEIVNGAGVTASETAKIYDEMDILEFLEERMAMTGEEDDSGEADESAQGELESTAETESDEVETSSSNSAYYRRTRPLESTSSFPRARPSKHSLASLAASPARSPRLTAVPDALDALPPLPDGSDSELADTLTDTPSSPPPPYTYWPTAMFDYSSSLLHRALLQLQSPPAMMPWEKMPSVMPTLPWEKMVPQLHLPDIPMVFQVAVPSWPPSLPWQSSPNNGVEKGPTYDWRGLYGGTWWQKSDSAAKEGMRMFMESQSKRVEQDMPGSSSTDAPPGMARPARRVDYDDLDMTDGEVNSFTYQTGTEVRRVQNDRMLVLFWIPILIIVASWGIFQSVPYVFHAFNYCTQYIRPRVIPL